MHDSLIEFPRSLADYPSLPGRSVLEVLRTRIDIDPFNAVASVLFLLAVTHTFIAPRFVAA